MGDAEPTASDSVAAASNRVLCIACAFPPTGGPGVQRVAKFVKFLPEHGWTPSVWAASALPSLPRDATLLDDLPREVIVYRHSVAQTSVRLAGLRAGTYFGEFMARLPFAAARRVAVDVGAEMTPDEYCGWARSSVSPVCELIHRQNIRALYSTYSPASNHLLALEVKQRTGLPWVADFRDLWTDDYRYRESSPRRRAAHERLQQEILETADAVVAVTRRQSEILAGHVPGMAEKFVAITNGFDPEDFATASSDAGRTNDRFVLSYVGRLDRWRASDALFDGLTAFVDDMGDRRSTFHLRVVGHADQATQARMRNTGTTCEFRGYVSHSEAVREMCAADALLLVVPDGPNADSVIPAKLFEYLAALRPILVVGPDGESAEIVRQCRAGIAVGLDSDAIHSALRSLTDRWRSGQPVRGCSPTVAARFSRRGLTAELARILDACVSGTGPATGRVAPVLEGSL